MECGLLGIYRMKSELRLFFNKSNRDLAVADLDSLLTWELDDLAACVSHI